MRRSSTVKTSRFHRFTTLVVAVAYFQVNVVCAAAPSLSHDFSAFNFSGSFRNVTIRVSTFLSHVFALPVVASIPRATDVLVFHAGVDPDEQLRLQQLAVPGAGVQEDPAGRVGGNGV